MGRRTSAVLFVAILATGACDAVGERDAIAARLDGERVEIVGPWQDVEAQRFTQVLEAFERATGADAVYTSTGGADIVSVLDARLAAGDPPELAMLPQPGLLADYARNGRLVPIGAVVGDAVRAGWPARWRELGTVDGQLFGVWFKAANKSLVWYDIATFERAGVVPPSDPEGFVAVADAVVAAGVPAFVVAGESQWTLTDWFENLYLRLAGPARYDALATRRLAWTDASVVEALTVMARLLSPPRATGGAEGMRETSFTESVALVFGQSPPAAAMVVEGDFVGGVISGSTDAVPGIDADVFPFPDPDPARRLVVSGGDAAVMFDDTPAARQLLRYLASPQSAAVWARLGGFVSPNDDVDLTIYPDDISEAIARSLVEAGDGFRFDLSDLQPPAFGASTGEGLFGILARFVVESGDPVVTAAALEEAASRAYGALSAKGSPAA